MTPQRFAQRVRNDLRARRWLRWHCFLIGLLTLLAGWACSHALMRLGADALWLRYGASFAVAYSALMLLLYLWARWLLSRGEADGLQIDGGGSGGGSSSHSGGDLSSLKAGGGGDFGGAGSGGSFDAPDLPAALSDGAGDAVGGALEIAGAADEGAIVLIPIALVVGIALALGAVLGFAVFGLFGVEVLLAVAVEIAIAAVGGAIAYKAGAEGWLVAAWRRTAWPAVATLACVVLIGAAIDHWLPAARSLPHALRLLGV
jgi:hypothetical protein